MSFISGMVTSLKNNKRTRKNALEILKENGEYSSKTELHFDKKATKNQLKRIREEIKKENKIRFWTKVLLISSITLIVIYIIGFVKF